MAGGTWDEDVLPLKSRVAPPRSISIVPVIGIGVVAHDPINTCRGLLPSNFLELEAEQRWWHNLTHLTHGDYWWSLCELVPTIHSKSSARQNHPEKNYSSNKIFKISWFNGLKTYDIMVASPNWNIFHISKDLKCFVVVVVVVIVVRRPSSVVRRPSSVIRCLYLLSSNISTYRTYSKKIILDLCIWKKLCYLCHIYFGVSGTNCTYEKALINNIEAKYGTDLCGNCYWVPK